MAFQARDQFCPTNDDACLGPAQQFVSAETGQVHAGRHAVLDQRLRGQAKRLRIEQRAAAEVVYDGHTGLVPKSYNILECRFVGEPGDEKVAGMDTQNRRRLFA